MGLMGLFKAVFVMRANMGYSLDLPSQLTIQVQNTTAVLEVYAWGVYGILRSQAIRGRRSLEL